MINNLKLLRRCSLIYFTLRSHTRPSQKFGGLCMKVGQVTAEDLFANEEKFESKNRVFSYV